MTLLSVGIITGAAAVVVVGAYMLLRQEQKKRRRQPRMNISDIAKGNLRGERLGLQNPEPSPWSVSNIDGRDARDYPLDSSTAPAEQPSTPDMSSSTPTPIVDSSPGISPATDPGAGGV